MRSGVPLLWCAHHPRAPCRRTSFCQERPHRGASFQCLVATTCTRHSVALLHLSGQSAVYLLLFEILHRSMPLAPKVFFERASAVHALYRLRFEFFPFCKNSHSESLRSAKGSSVHVPVHKARTVVLAAFCAEIAANQGRLIGLGVHYEDLHNRSNREMPMRNFTSNL